MVQLGSAHPAGCLQEAEGSGTSDVDMALLLDAPGACDLLQIVIIGLLSTHSGLELLQPACCVI